MVTYLRPQHASNKLLRVIRLCKGKSFYTCCKWLCLKVDEKVCHRSLLMAASHCLLISLKTQ